MTQITLSEDQKQSLHELSNSAPDVLVHRARLILAYADGKPTMQAASEAGISRGRARFWKRQYLSRGMDIFNLISIEKIQDEETELVKLKSASDLVVDRITEEEKEEVHSESEVFPYPEVRSAIGVTANDSLAEAGRKVWNYHFAVMLSHEQGTLLGDDIEELHDMRVATRRMRSAFDIFAPAFNPKIMKRYLKGLRSLGGVLGQVRDMDVIYEKGLQYQEKLRERNRSGMEPLIQSWKLIIDHERTKLLKHLRSEEYQHFKQEFNRFLQVPIIDKMITNPGTEVVSRIRDIVPILIYSRFAAVNAYEAILPIASINQLHALRIEFKKFRYTLEYFKEILDESTTKTINEIKQYQDHLGELHDADVACQLVSGFLKNWDKNQANSPILERTNPEQIVMYLAYLYAERHRLMVTFPEVWKQFCRAEFRANLAKVITFV